MIWVCLFWMQDCDGLAQAERDFAADSRQNGMVTAFLNHFAPHGLVFQPSPIVCQEAFRDRENPKGTLDWAPEATVIAGDGSLGFSTGPYTYQDAQGQRVGTGQFSSVWAPDDEGRWQVLLDCGSPFAIELESLPSTASCLVAGKSSDSPISQKALLELDSHFEAALAGPDQAAGLLVFWHEAGRLLRPGSPTWVGLDAVRAREGAWDARHYEVLGHGMAGSSDLAYTYGRMELLGPDGWGQAYYWHAWVRNEKGNWQIWLEAVSPAPIQP
ncbi:MAG: hypothetical protein KDC71_01640 [Acidobacteria bacterium]|nr:hypothetical protein [Acidobacteriota bacterium]